MHAASEDKALSTHMENLIVVLKNYIQYINSIEQQQAISFYFLSYFLILFDILRRQTNEHIVL